MTTKALREYAQKSLELRTALRGAMQFGNLREEKRLHYELVTNNAVIVDALIDYLERQEKSERNHEASGDTKLGVAINGNIDIAKDSPVETNRGHGFWHK